MTQFNGFSDGKINITMVHAQFISEVVPLIDDLAELKVCLFCYYALTQKEGEHRYLVRADFVDNPELMQGLRVIADDTDEILDRALEKAVAHGFLLAGDVVLDTEQALRLYFMNTGKGRIAIEQLAAGNWQPKDKHQIEILPERPSVFTLYEENIGALTPIIADHLKQAQDDYPYHWIVDAIKLSIENNVRRWAYINAILERWKQEGRADVNETAERSNQRTNEFAGLNWSDFASE